ncbi:MAG: EAL domain-containing protein [Candidatus Izemoplasmatales bacterium]|nr:EAL domain-containing protein [Candidatus Izemoplasmatales bacterium]
MMLYTSNTQRDILSIGLIIIFLIVIYVLWILIRKEKVHALKTKFSAMDSVISYKKMLNLLQFRIGQKGENSFFSLVMVSVDNFDQILEYADESSTSEYIQRVAKMLEIVLPLGAKLAQTKERETFLIYLPDHYSKDTFLHLAEKFKEMAEKRIELSNGIFIEKSTSVALINFPDDEVNIDDLNNGLKATIYRIRKEGGNNIGFYSADMIQEKTYYEAYQKLRNAIKTNAIETIYNPFFSRLDKFMAGVEIDIVWHKTSGDETFKSFMPNLESSDDSYWFCLWMLEKALSSHISMIGMNRRVPYEIMIPVGVRQFENEMVFDDMINILEKYQLEPQQLVLKIMNPLQVSQETQFIKSLIQLQSTGVRLAIDVNKIDDSLYLLLNEYKIDVILLDQSLLTKQHDKLMEVEELINFTIANHIDIIATMIQSKDQVDKLDNHIDKIQGPLCCAPMNKEQLLNHLNKKLDI